MWHLENINLFKFIQNYEEINFYDGLVEYKILEYLIIVSFRIFLKLNISYPVLFSASTNFGPCRFGYIMGFFK